MKPAAFDYVRPRTLGEVHAALARFGRDAKLLAGGQSLVPLLNFRLLRPTALIDINRVSGLDVVDYDPACGLRVGALTRHRTLEVSAVVERHYPVIHAAMAHVAHLAIRNRGTIGGSLSHADPAAELPMLALLLDAEITAESAGGRRASAARDFFRGALTNALAEDEIVTEVRFPPLPLGAGWDFAECAQRAGDFAIAAAGAIMRLADGRIAEARLALMGVDETPIRVAEAERLLLGQAGSPALFQAAAESARAAVSPN
ncbi:MAG TPA: FAD binding domain-containing protein, partial [Candidatus Sulfotelmatobacter sp.]|nr:FAD binding domain-containing protein [Candidatus Sulfotelmatobacter sp.]